MAVTISLRVDELLEKQISLAAKSQGITRTQFLINAAEMALGKREPHALLRTLKAVLNTERAGKRASVAALHCFALSPGVGLRLARAFREGRCLTFREGEGSG